jgi:hypothetical protein
MKPDEGVTKKRCVTASLICKLLKQKFRDFFDGSQLDFAKLLITRVA